MKVGKGRLKRMTEAERAHRRQLQKAASLTHVDLNAQSPSDFVKIQADLHEFLSMAGVHMLVPLERATVEAALKSLVPRPYVSEMLDGIRETLQLISVTNYAGSPLQTDPYRLGTVSLSAAANVTLQVRADSPSTSFRSSFAMEPNKESARWALLHHLTHSGLTPDRVLLCPREGCRNVFVLGISARSDRNRYCSIKCSRIAAMKAYRERQANKKAKLKSKKRRGKK
jgi:predicted RNA-binding Zn ribbon-like protein